MVATVRSRTASSESSWTQKQSKGEYLGYDCANNERIILKKGHRRISPKCNEVEINTHRALGNNVAEEFLIDNSSIPLLFEVETKQHSHLRLIRLILWIHLKQTYTLLIKQKN